MIASPGATMGVDFEKRVDFDRLRKERLARASVALEASDLGALLLFDMNNIRYIWDFGIINGIEYVIPTMILGGVGTMSALGGVAPRLVNDLWNAWEAKEHDRARDPASDAAIVGSADVHPAGPTGLPRTGRD